MDSKGRTFPDRLFNQKIFWIVRNEPDNEITGRFRSLDEAKHNALSGNVIYEARETVLCTAVMVVEDFQPPVFPDGKGHAYPVDNPK